MSPDKKTLLGKIHRWQEAGEKIVFTNGCFDLLHYGHVSFLQEASTLGDRLVIGLNTDDSVSKLKGPERPVNDLLARTKILEALKFVDVVIPFAEDNPLALIKEIKPQVLVKGGDYQMENIVGSKFVLKNGGLVKSLKFVEGYSTTDLIKRIKEEK